MPFLFSSLFKLYKISYFSNLLYGHSFVIVAVDMLMHIPGFCARLIFAFSTKLQMKVFYMQIEWCESEGKTII